MIDLLLILKQYHELEEELSKFYLWLSEVFLTDEEISKFFSKLYIEEEQHKSMILYQMRLIKMNPIQFRNKTINGALLKKTKEFLSAFLSKTNNIGLEKALKISLILEACTMESYFSSAFSSLSPELNNLNKNMLNASHNHYEKIKKFMTINGFDVPGIPKPEIENIEKLEELLEECFN